MAGHVDVMALRRLDQRAAMRLVRAFGRGPNIRKECFISTIKFMILYALLLVRIPGYQARKMQLAHPSLISL